MTRFAKLFLCLTIVLLAAWRLPWCYEFLSARADKSPFTLYSSVARRFLQLQPAEGGPLRTTPDGAQRFTQHEFDSLLPFFYARQLTADGRFPATIDGVAFTPHQAQRGSFTFRTAPSDLNAPHAGLYPLLESHSGRVRLEMPGDVFRITATGIEFVDMQTNTIDTAKSGLFTRTMLRKGFRFPARTLAGNPTARKDYDEGYVLLDAAGQLYHLKMVCGRPFVRKVDLPPGIRPRELFLTEFQDRSMLALLTDDEHRLHAVRLPDYRTVTTGIPRFDPRTERLTIFGNPLDWTCRITSPEADRHYALRADDLSLLDSLRSDSSRPLPALRFVSPADKYVRPRLGR